MKLSKAVVTWDTELSHVSGVTCARQRLFVRGRNRCGQWVIRVWEENNNNKVKDRASQCQHRKCQILALPDQPDAVLESCADCDVIRRYDVKNAACDVVFWNKYLHLAPTSPMTPGHNAGDDDLDRNSPTLSKQETTEIQEELKLDDKPLAMCLGPQNTILLKTPGTIAKLEWSRSNPDVLQIAEAMRHTDTIERLAFVPNGAVALVMQTCSPRRVMTLTFPGGVKLWSRSSSVTPTGLTCDPKGHVFFSELLDTGSSRLLLLDSGTGHLLQILLEENELRASVDVQWMSCSPPKLAVLDRSSGVVAVHTID